jgi:hypothetical protein
MNIIIIGIIFMIIVMVILKLKNFSYFKSNAIINGRNPYTPPLSIKSSAGNKQVTR